MVVPDSGGSPKLPRGAGLFLALMKPSHRELFVGDLLEEYELHVLAAPVPDFLQAVHGLACVFVEPHRGEKGYVRDPAMRTVGLGKYEGVSVPLHRLAVGGLT